MRSFAPAVRQQRRVIQCRMALLVGQLCRKLHLQCGWAVARFAYICLRKASEWGKNHGRSFATVAAMKCHLVSRWHGLQCLGQLAGEAVPG